MIITELWTLKLFFEEKYKNSYELGRGCEMDECDSLLAFRRNSHYYEGALFTEKSSITKELMKAILRAFGESDSKLASLSTDELWEEAEGYSSNLEYLIDFAVEDINPRRGFFNSAQVNKSLCIFFNKWFERDDFYKSAAVQTSFDDYIVVAVTYDDDEDEG